MMSSERKAKVNNFLGTCMDLVLGVVNPVKKCLDATIYKCFRITIGRKGFLKIFHFRLERYVRRTNIEISRYKREEETFLYIIGIKLSEFVNKPVEVHL
jgi:hypothetical protein